MFGNTVDQIGAAVNKSNKRSAKKTVDAAKIQEAYLCATDAFKTDDRKLAQQWYVTAYRATAGIIKHPALSRKKFADRKVWCLELAKAIEQSLPTLGITLSLTVETSTPAPVAVEAAPVEMSPSKDEVKKAKAREYARLYRAKKKAEKLSLS